MIDLIVSQERAKQAVGERFVKASVRSAHPGAALNAFIEDDGRFEGRVLYLFLSRPNCFSLLHK